MSNWQDWVVALLLVLCMGRIVYNVVRSFRRAGRGESPCSHCSGACSSRHFSVQDDSCCCQGQKKNKKSCCK